MDESVSPGRFLASRDGGAENPGEERGKSEGGVMRGVVDVLPVAEDATDDADDAEEDLDAIAAILACKLGGIFMPPTCT